ncbi:lanthionine synthetase LanC family protein [Streptococcus ruminantium]
MKKNHGINKLMALMLLGLLMVLAEMARKLNKKIDLFELAKYFIEVNEYDDCLEIDLSVCHGAAGIVQSLLFVYATTDDRRFLELANNFWEKSFRIAKKNGYYTGEESRDYLLGYFLGWSGIIDTAILLRNYNKDEKSYIPLNLSSKDYQKELFNSNMNSYGGSTA